MTVHRPMASAATGTEPYSYDDFMPGRMFTHHWGRTITESDAILFSTQTHQSQPAQFNTSYARAHGLKHRPVSELLVFSIVLGLTVEDLSESGGPFLGADNIEFLEPVFATDTLHAASSVLSRRPSASRPDWGVVTWRTVGTNQHGAVVISYIRSSLVRRTKGATS